MFRPSTPDLGAKAWMPATSAGMTVEIDASYVGNALDRGYCGLGLGIAGLAGLPRGALALDMHFVMKLLRAAPLSF